MICLALILSIVGFILGVEYMLNRRAEKKRAATIEALKNITKTYKDV